MSLPIVLLPEARAEFDDAADWYDQQQPGLGSRFMATVHTALDQIRDSPELHGFIAENVHAMTLRRFPFMILYRVEADRIAVLAVFHSSRDPSEWKGRI